MSTVTPETTSDLHFTDQLALVAHDLRQVSLWLEGHRDTLEDLGLRCPTFDGSASNGTLRLLFYCPTPRIFDAAVAILQADRRATVSIECRGNYVHAERRFGTVIVAAFRQWVDVDRAGF